MTALEQAACAYAEAYKELIDATATMKRLEAEHADAVLRKMVVEDRHAQLQESLLKLCREMRRGI